MQTLTSSPKRWWALVAIVLCTLTLGFDTTILNVALPTLATELDAGTSELQWIVDAYVLVVSKTIWTTRSAGRNGPGATFASGTLTPSFKTRDVATMGYEPELKRSRTSRRSLVLVW